MEESNYRTQMLEELVTKQLESLEIAKELLDMKSRLVELCEQETEIYKSANQYFEQENKKLSKSLLIASIGLVIIITIDVIRLFL